MLGFSNSLPPQKYPIPQLPGNLLFGAAQASPHVLSLKNGRFGGRSGEHPGLQNRLCLVLKQPEARLEARRSPAIPIGEPLQPPPLQPAKADLGPLAPLPGGLFAAMGGRQRLDQG